MLRCRCFCVISAFTLIACSGKSTLGPTGVATAKALLAELDEAFAEAHRSVTNMKNPAPNDLSHALDDVRAALANLQRQTTDNASAQSTIAQMLEALNGLERQLAKKGPASLADFRTTFDKLKGELEQLRKVV
jgi:ABC-type transporter Mla subunit MlaD